ncbi:hypothetical protein [Nocardioides zhouii]|uniref:DUF4175 domain-containing protein n=1 Tax=Nocardioides zhouii TaxID=1168729 RepID=A0A4Q2SIR1_9ACTN|nr:hypothetical protein [Nocardioides zhouii]RYC03854.1 hypothetical protein EUA94_21280 [Nocardioides zhouii]
MPTRPVREPLSPLPFAGMIGLACVAFVIGATPLVVPAPWWAVALLVLLWVVALVLAISWFTSRPRTVVVIPLALTLVWFATVVGGAKYLGWS